jgi:sporulation protein YlmC with PRC-barrel domain
MHMPMSTPNGLGRRAGSCMRSLLSATVAVILMSASGSVLAETGRKGARLSDRSRATLRSMPVSFYQLRPSDVMASNLVGSPVFNLKGQRIGEVKDLVLARDKSVRAVVVDIGEFLKEGKRPHLVGIRPSSLVIARSRREGKGKVELVINAVQGSFRNAPIAGPAGLSGSAQQ